MSSFCLITSIGQGQSSQVEKCIRSWIGKHDVYSINSREEIDSLRPFYPGVEFIPAPRTGENLFKKTVVSIGNMIDFGRFIDRDICIINSDILLTEPIVFDKEDGIGIGSRYDYNLSTDKSKSFGLGFDYCVIPKKFFHFLWGMDYYYLGEPWWDYVIPYRCIKSRVPVYSLDKKIAFHKKHDINYSAIERRYFESIVMSREEDLYKFKLYGGQGLNKHVLGIIKDNIRKV